MRQLQVRNRSDCRNPPLKTAPATRWEADVHNRAKTRFPRQEVKTRIPQQRAKAEQIKTSRMKKEARRSAKPPFAPLGRKPRISQVKRPKPNQSNDARSTARPSPIAHAVPSATRLARWHRPHAPEPHAHRATDEYPGPSSARSRASPSRARGTHRRALARSPRPRRPAAPRTPARAHASSR